MTDTADIADAVDTGGEDVTQDTSFETSGAHRWAKTFGSASSDNVAAIVVEPQGDVVMTGHVAGEVDFGAGTQPHSGSADAFVLRLDQTGTHIWSRTFATDEGERGRAIAVSDDGHVYASGTFQDTIDFGAGPHTSAGSLDVFLVGLDP